MAEANGLDVEGTAHLRERMVELIKIVEGFYACGIASSGLRRRGRLGLRRARPGLRQYRQAAAVHADLRQHRIAHEVSGGLVVALPGPDEDHNPETAGSLGELLKGRADLPYGERMEVARLIEDLTASGTAGWYSVISCTAAARRRRRGWQSSAAIPVEDKVALVEKLLDRGVLAPESGAASRDRQPGRCCPVGCREPDETAASAKRAGN